MPRSKNSESDILKNNHIKIKPKNDSEILKKKGVISPDLNKMYAVAFLDDNNNTSIYFKNVKALEKFKKKSSVNCRYLLIKTEKNGRKV